MEFVTGCSDSLHKIAAERSISMEMHDEIADPLWMALNFNTFERLNKIQKHGARFVHYTSAENAYKMIAGEQVWLRNLQSMNDFMEVRHGADNLAKALNKEDGSKKEFWAALDQIRAGLSERIIEKFNKCLPMVQQSTFAFCMSEHRIEEDEIGRLSMWRAYGNKSGSVAIVVDGSPFLSSSQGEEIGAFTLPIDYLDATEVENVISKLASKLIENSDAIRDVPEDKVVWQITVSLLMRALSNKHPGFKEELEWRIVYNELFGKGKILKQEVESINGVPQLVNKLPVADYANYGLQGTLLHQIVDRIIIGPSDQAWLIYDAFVRALQEKKVENAADKVIVSDIPLR
ncbi:MAG TPA: DUF2971 domain-containing protein [Parvularculaceae bacterium]|nr:DUF2971 domain-containing protein [Parvularculaceae bacterium]